MTDRAVLGLILGAGVVAEIVVLTLPGFRLRRIWRLALAIVAAALGFMGARAAEPGLVHVQILGAAAAFALAAFLLLKNEILPRISESSLLLGTVVLWYLIANVNAQREIVYALAGAAVLPTAGTVVIALVIRDWGERVKRLCYVWFLVQSAVMSVLLLRFADLAFVLNSGFEAPNEVSLLATGMGITYLAASLFYIWTFAPIFLRGRLEDWWGDAKLMASRFADYEMHIPEAVLTVAIPGALFVVNSQLRVVPVELLASGVLVLQRFGSNLLFRRRNRAAGKPAAVSSEA